MKKERIQELIKNRFELKVKFKIERKDDIDTISNKVFDFSSNTITRLIEEGIRDSLDYLVKNDYLVEKDKEDKKCSPEETYEHLLKFIASIGETTLEKEEIYMKDLATNLQKKIANSMNFTKISFFMVK